MNEQTQQQNASWTHAANNRQWQSIPELMTEEELIRFLRIPEISDAQDHHNVIEHLKRFRGLPRIHLCNKVLYPHKAIQKWIEGEISQGK